ncbi:GNAT family N-acetyltransferase [Paenibacillus cellulosilyticus]|uniref:GNAT family N-acetyltransferase n=1 Tax=Paenibacillus cellulosilyticus TaxID=375489 RepID=UPI000D70FFE8|nr:GNAT family N-acetyltransferase [Paenibacillus cellulosilyticus]QKS44978.1 GNAT family N-acetyltransferase [Paenibacillus cellulosilyticus]
MVQIDLEDEGVTLSVEHQLSEEELRLHREKIMRFVTEADRGAFICEDGTGARIGLLMYSIVNREGEYLWPTIFRELDRGMLQEDGRFIEIFQLWVHPDHRRSGIATKLKLQLEEEARIVLVNLIYTHTEERNLHVLKLNERLGYREVRRGPIWDEVVRVSLIKQLSC